MDSSKNLMLVGCLFMGASAILMPTVGIMTGAALLPVGAALLAIGASNRAKEREDDAR
jgi:hypothetical protein